MGYYRVAIRSTDRNFSRYIRRRGACEICGRTDLKLENAHYFGRGREATRFDDKNCHCLCFTCHKKSHEDKDYYKNWMIEKYGQNGLDRLELESNQRKDRDDVMDKIYIKALLESVGMKWQ
jgi:hypothetical protein